MDVLNLFFSLLLWGVLACLVVILVNPKTKIYNVCIRDWNKKNTIITSVIALVLAIICIIPMKLSPYWNGEIPDHRNQYEIAAESLLDGHLYLNYDVDERLLEMDNPYDPAAREELGVEYHFDHAFYNGHYYMYFGVVPVFLLFLPFRLITGTALTTYHATQIFVAIFIFGVFRLLFFLSKKFFKELPKVLYWILSIAFSTMSIWYSVGTPALYCTAITSGLCLEIWSLYFFFKAVFGDGSLNKKIVFAFVGALLGALTFGCRPTIAIANLLVIPLLIVFLKENKFSLKLLGKLFLAASPYFIIGGLLMAYNYARFDNPFEFGQTFQLTVADQTAYENIKITDDIAKIFNTIIHNMFDTGELNNKFPFISPGGAISNFLILIVPLTIFFNSKILARIKERKLFGLTICLFAVPIIISVIEGLWSPFLLERYHMDVYWIMGIFTFLILGFYYTITDSKELVIRIIAIWGLITFIKSILFYLYPCDVNITSLKPYILELMDKIVKFKL